MAIYRLYFLELLFVVVELFYFEVFDNFHFLHYTDYLRRTGRHFTRTGAEKIALKIIIWPKNEQFALKQTFLVYSEWGLKPFVNLFYTIEFVYNGLVSNNSPITLHFVQSRWHLLDTLQFTYNVISATTSFMQSPRGAIIGKFCSYP